ncbi:hypothetical protein AKO1_001106 [Acrasis kona]|uniref:RGS domain-containing protein n=1 Tax=Acrasis kona TaxID=1008807 RepID=A0AAW2ZE56_9EUKA
MRIIDMVKALRKNKDDKVKKTDKERNLSVLKRVSKRLSLFNCQSTTSPLWRKSRIIQPNKFKDSDKPTLLLYLNHPEIHEMMVEFARKEYSVENIFLWDNIQRYKRAKDVEKKQFISNFIMEKFITNTAALEVNVSGINRKELILKAKVNCLDDNLFDNAENDMIECLSDVYTRFVETPTFKIYIRNEVRKSVRGEIDPLVLSAALNLIGDLGQEE